VADSNILIPAFLLDLAIGDPRWLPHPVRIMGKCISRMESILRGRFGKGREKAAGIVLVASIVVPAFIAAALAQRMLGSFSSDLSRTIGTVIIIYIASTTLALRGLADSARLVIKAAKDGCMEDARKKLAMIVGRDTGRLSEEGVLRATIETLAENLSDGFMAPLFYLAVGGLPLAIAYKAINTLDSMVGYKNERYVDFGRAAAKLDDIANYVPARITGLILVLAVFLSVLFTDAHRPLSAARSSFRIMKRDGRNHTSPNSGVPEAAMAGALGVRLGGPSTYGGVLIEKPFIGDIGTADYRAAADRAVTLAVIAAVSAVVFAACILSIRTLL
jgi:adenosylcobinamide-phosphate synthase